MNKLRSLLSIWKCDCCDFLNLDSLEKCSYCELPREHTFEELQKYQLVYKNDKNLNRDKGMGVITVFLSSLGYVVRTEPQFALVMLVFLLASLPLVKDHMMVFIPIAFVIVMGVFLYLFAKEK